jgi:tetratricopeptide (TPR) repeat protein
LITKENPYDKKKLAKALYRKANALLKLGKLEDSISSFERALEESPEDYIKTGLFNAKKTKQDLLGWGQNNLNSEKVWRPEEEN